MLEALGAEEKAGHHHIRRSYLHTHQASAAGHIQDQGTMGWAAKGSTETIHSKARGSVLQSSHILGAEHLV